MKRKIKVEAGSGNIFADLGLPDAETHFLKAQIVAEIYRLTNQRKLTQVHAGELMGISQPEVSRMFKGNFREYSVDRLMAFLTAFDRDVEIVVRPRKKSGKADGSSLQRSRPSEFRRMAYGPSQTANNPLTLVRLSSGPGEPRSWIPSHCVLRNAGALSRTG